MVQQLLQLRLANEEYAEDAVDVVHLLVGDEADLFEHLKRQDLGLVDDKEDRFVFFLAFLQDKYSRLFPTFLTIKDTLTNLYQRKLFVCFLLIFQILLQMLSE